MITYAEFERAVSRKLDLMWDSRKTQNIFDEIDRVFH